MRGREARVQKRAFERLRLMRLRYKIGTKGEAVRKNALLRPDIRRDVRNWLVKTGASIGAVCRGGSGAQSRQVLLAAAVSRTTYPEISSAACDTYGRLAVARSPRDRRVSAQISLVPNAAENQKQISANAARCYSCGVPRVVVSSAEMRSVHARHVAHRAPRLRSEPPSPTLTLPSPDGPSWSEARLLFEQGVNPYPLI